MNEIRKGSIVWDYSNKKKTKVLTTPGKGEVPDKIVLVYGRKYSDKFKNYVLLEYRDGGFMTHNNIPCYMTQIENIIPFKEYLEIQKHLQIKSN